MCNASIVYTSKDEKGEDVVLAVPCRDPNHFGETCYFHTKVKHGLTEPCLPEYAKDARVFIGDVQIWPVL